jgi:hypothetical protein
VKTTVDIPDETLDSAMRYSRSKTKRNAIVTALDEFNRRHRQAELVKFFGRFDTLPCNDDIEALDASDTRSWTGRPDRHGAAR